MATISGSLVGADLRGADLRGADLRDADLANANFDGAKLQSAKLVGKTLTSQQVGLVRQAKLDALSSKPSDPAHHSRAWWRFWN
jgi:uncharacterized protein YjbI with pentapeptide repeats